MADLKQLQKLVNLTVKEVNELATILKDEYESNQLLYCSSYQVVVKLLKKFKQNSQLY
jgi:hypothetical protein